VTVAQTRTLTRVAAALNRLPMVRWDRCHLVTYLDYDEPGVEVFGWIARQDGRSDFVLVEWMPWDEEDYFPFTTSSAEHSDRIAELLNGERGAACHEACRRVEDVFGDLVHDAIRLRDAG